MTNEEKYINNLRCNNAFILQHFMKLYYYRNSKSIASPVWTRDHWREELFDLFNPIDDNESRLFDRLSNKYNQNFKDALNPDLNDWNQITAMFSKGIVEKEEVHALPKISVWKLNKTKAHVFDLYKIFTKAVLERLNYSANVFTRNGFDTLLNIIINNKSHNIEKILQDASAIEFSIRYELLKDFYFNNIN